MNLAGILRQFGRHGLKFLPALYCRAVWCFFRRVPRVNSPEGLAIETYRDLIAYWTIFVQRDLSGDWEKSLMPGDVVVDIGANRGWFRDYAYSLCPGLKFIAFEPQARYRQRLERPDTKAYSLALGASDGTATLHLVNDSDGGNTGSLVLELQAPEVETVPVARLDSFTEDIDRIHTIKIDVDGGEIDLVRGGIKTISKAQYVICEVLNEGNLEVLKQLLPGWSFQRTSDTDYIGRNSTYAK